MNTDPSRLPTPTSPSTASPATAGLASAPPAWGAETLRALLPAFRVDETQVSLGYGEQWCFDAKPTGEAQPQGVTVLLEHGLIRVAGKDALTFLQGQLTNDMLAVSGDRAQASGYCNPKGRLLGTFWIWREGDTPADGSGGPGAEPSFLLACSRDLSTMLAKRLRMFVMRAKVKVEWLDASTVLLGLVGERAIEALTDALPAPVHLPRAGTSVRAIVPVEIALIADRVTRFAQASTGWLDTEYWRRLEIESGVARVNIATQERFVPQMLNFELTDGVSFTKGCYPGQEIVARTQYLGKSKRRMFIGQGQGDVPASAQDVHGDAGTSGEPVGTIVLAAASQAGHWVALFECRIAASDAALRVGTQALRLLALPYSISDAPAESAAS